ncbi:hypothetical protein [Leptothermofonsia sp. ETS-13]|uniref:hypothetical protein n=1 Tax=Leptothermofonsia sp. ETS-13 TaxID=3035696 RepID=UPI003B9EDC73
MLYHRSALETWVTGSAEWLPTTCEEALLVEPNLAEDTKRVPNTLAIAIGVAASLLFLGLATLVWGTAEVSKGSAMLNQNLAPVHYGSWEKLR